MKLHTLGSKDRMTRRKFLRIPQSKKNVIPIIDKEKCTGCGLCTIDCPTKAFVISQISEKETYQLVFRRENCNACGVCGKSCPEKCVHFVEQGSDQDRIGKEASPSPPQHSDRDLPSTQAQAERLRVDPERGQALDAAGLAKVIFEDKISRCMECGIPLFPQAMVKKLKSKMFMTQEEAWPFHLCPSCRMKSQFKNEMIEK
jgi:ferredoxin